MYSPILDRQALLQLLQMKSMLGSVGTDAALRRVRSLLSPFLTLLSAVTASLQWLWSAAATSQSAGLILLHTAGCWARRPGTTSSWCWWSTWYCPRPSRPRASTAAAALPIRFSVQCLGRVAGDIGAYNPGQKSLEQHYNILIFLSFLSSLLKQCIILEIFLQFSLPLPYTKLKFENNSGHASNVVCGGEGRGWTCVNWKTPHQRKSVPRLLSMIVGKWSPPPPRVLSRWRCLAYCWRLGQEVLVFLRLMVRPNSLQVCAKELQAPREAGRLWWVSTLLAGGCLAWGGR